MTERIVAVVHLGREKGLGALRRVRSMRDIFEAAGATVVEVPLLAEHPARAGDLLHMDLGSLLRGDILPESLAWSLTSAERRLEEIDPDLVICNTARSFNPRLVERWPVMLDLVDRLSVSYADRAHAPGIGLRRVPYRMLAPTARRFERRVRRDRILAVAAGLEDAVALGADWVPNTVVPGDLPERARTIDVVFFGNLSYPPNIEAIEEIGRFWPRVIQERPETTLMVAGAHLNDTIRDLTRAHGWRIWSDFPDLATMLAEVRLAVAPLRHASGIQSKVLEAGAMGVAQVLSPAALAGLAPGFPAAIAHDDATWATHIVSLLEDDDRRRDLGSAARSHVADTYSVERWASWAAETMAALGR